MRFNSRELSHLASQVKGQFDKQGELWIKEKQEGLFRKGESYVERLFRLRGNLLFYFKTTAVSPVSECIGVLVLERYAVMLASEDERDHTFKIAFEGEDKEIQLAANTEDERDGWIESLHIASYECMMLQMDSLREQIKQKTGKDPIENPEPAELVEYHPDTDGTKEPFLEMCLSCDNLVNEASKPPNVFVSVAHQTLPNRQWITHAHTEIVERSNRPEFLTTIGFYNPKQITKNTRIRLMIYNVKERMTNTMTNIGTAQFSIDSLLTSPDNRLHLRLNSSDFENAGYVTVMGWHDNAELLLESETSNGVLTSSDEQDGRESMLSDRSTALKRKGSNVKRLQALKPLYANIISKTYRFPTNANRDLSVHEYMGESKLTYHIPTQLLKLWVEEEKSRIEAYQDLGELAEPWNETHKELIDFIMSSVTMYKQHAHYLKSYQGPPFKPSVKKGHKEVEFAPTNLHLQRMIVQNDDLETKGCYDWITVGAFTAYAQRYKNGGLARQLKQLKESLTENMDGKNKLEKVNEILNQITTLRIAVHTHSEAVCRSACQGDSAELNNSMSVLADKTRQLIAVCENTLIEQGIADFGKAKLQTAAHMRYSVPNMSSSAQDIPRAPSPNRSWKWSGTDFIKSPTEEPWEMTRLNTEASTVCITSKLEDLNKSNEDVTQWLEEISPLVIKLKSCVEVMVKRAKSSLLFLTIEESCQNVGLMHTVKYRRDVVFSQALTAAVAGFMTKLRSCITDEDFLRQAHQIGVLMQFEGLLSCHSDELGMLEDFKTGVQDLSSVSFKIELGKGPDDVLPTIKGNRTGYVVHIPVTQNIFSLIPKELQRGQTIKITPVIFSIGINEQATFAEKFGDTSFQENLNKENYKKLNSYVEKYVEIIGEPEVRGRGSQPVDQLMRLLNMNVLCKKNKNIEVLHLAAEVCRTLNGVRFISCKSAKDRTAMAVTLESVQLLQREHDLASHVFLHALDCMRSEGLRRENTLKNAGTRKYAFNSIQLLSIPKLYRPPSGTFGNVQT